MNLDIKDLNGNQIPVDVMDCFKNEMMQKYIQNKYKDSKSTTIAFDGDFLRGAMDYLANMQQENMLNDIGVNAGTMGVGYMQSSLPDPVEPYIEKAMELINKCYKIVLENKYQIIISD